MSLHSYYHQKLFFKKIVFESIVTNDESRLRYYLKDEHHFGRNDYWRFYEIAVYRQSWRIAFVILSEFIDNPFLDRNQVGRFIEDLVYYFQDEDLWPELAPILHASLRLPHFDTFEAKKRVLELIIRISAFNYLDGIMEKLFKDLLSSEEVQDHLRRDSSLLSLSLSLGSTWCTRVLLENFANVSRLKCKISIPVISSDIKSYLHICKMLYFSGFPINNFNVINLIDDHKYAIMIRWFRSKKGQVMSLNDLCRIKIRNHFGSRCLAVVKNHEYPAFFKDFLQLRDIE